MTGRCRRQRLTTRLQPNRAYYIPKGLLTTEAARKCRLLRNSGGILEALHLRNKMGTQYDSGEAGETARPDSTV